MTVVIVILLLALKICLNFIEPAIDTQHLLVTGSLLHSGRRRVVSIVGAALWNDAARGEGPPRHTPIIY